MAAAALDSESASIINHLQTNHTAAARFQVDFSFEVLEANASTPKRAFEPTIDFFETHCDPAPVPIPSGGALEGETDYECSTNGDCHLLVVQRDTCRLYEQWRANIDGTNTYYGGCLAIWNIAAVPPASGRGEYCTSADGAGLPITPLLFTADEIQSGEIKHALRFILPNGFIRDDRYVHPGTHCPNATSGGPNTPVYSMRFRLKSDVNISGLKPAARVVAQALKTYGMFLADGGNITFVAQSDTRTQAKWADVDFGPHDLKSLRWSDFEVVEGGERFIFSDGDCTRTPITE